MKTLNGLKEDDPVFDGDDDLDELATLSEPVLTQRFKTEAQAVEAILAAQRAGGDAVDPAGARKFVRMLIAVGLFKPS